MLLNIFSYLIETCCSILMLIDAGNILTDSAARRLVFGRHIDLILKNKHDYFPFHLKYCDSEL